VQFLVELMIKAAMTGSVDDCLSIVAYGDRHLSDGSCADPELVERLVTAANARLRMFERARSAFERSGRPTRSGALDTRGSPVTSSA